MDSTRAIMERLDQISPSESIIGTFQRIVGASAVVNVLGSETPLPFSGPLPSPGDPVQIEMRNGSYVMTGPVKPKPTRGRVTATGTPTITVLGSDGVSYSLPFMSAYTPAVNDDVAIEWTFEGGLVKGRVSTTPVAPTAPGVETPAQTYHPAPFLASAAGYHVLSSGAYNGNWVPNYGIGQAAAAWYGATIVDSIPAAAVVTMARIFLSTTLSQYGGPAIQVIGGTSPQGRVAVGGTYPLDARSGWVGIPTAVVDLLKASGRGISIIGATSPSGSDRYRPLSQDPQSFALDIAWRV